jgi:ubiquitin-conjugating enzyme E2 variant
MKPTPKTAAIVSRYTAWHRGIDVCAIALFGALAGWGLLRLGVGLGQSEQLWVMAAAALAAWLAVDLLSGLVHWAFDTWGSVHTPLLGARYIRPFREHHWDPQAMTRHDFVETNGSSCVAALPLLTAAALVPVEESTHALAQAVLVFVALGVLITNQCHKWAHLPPERTPQPVRIAQKLRLILRPEDHLRHHVRPFDSHYCTAAGWLNRPLHAIGFFRALECGIAALTRSRARADDLR